MASLILLAALFGLSQLLLFIMDYNIPEGRVPTKLDKMILSIQNVLFGGPDDSKTSDGTSGS